VFDVDLGDDAEALRIGWGVSVGCRTASSNQIGRILLK
jgi:hypothetical protein